MLIKCCSRCGRRIIDKECVCKVFKKPSSKHMIDVDVEERNKFYNTENWRKAKEKCIAKCNGIDIYSLYMYNRIEYGYTVHHIVPLEYDYSLRLSSSNLIYLTESNHQQMHELYKTDYKSTVKLLKSLLVRYQGV